MRRGRSVPGVDGLNGDWIATQWVTIDDKTGVEMQIGNDKRSVGLLQF